jgi:hypothetical protein
MSSGQAHRALGVHILKMHHDLLEVKMRRGIFYFAPCGIREARCDQIFGMPSIYPRGLIQANRNQISTSDVGVHLVLAVGWRVGLHVRPRLARGYVMVDTSVGLWLCGPLA